MKKVVVMLLLFSMMATAPSYALDLAEKVIYKEVQIGTETVLVNRFTKRVVSRLEYGKYVQLPTTKGFEDAPSIQEIYQSRYNDMTQ
ncbi:MAG: hypothetical protein WC592_06015 [Candidatus Omnitrophota bacterium]